METVYLKYKNTIAAKPLVGVVMMSLQKLYEMP